jgi:hypothetical protein
MIDAPSVPIGDSKTNNGISVRLYLNVGTVSQTVRSGNEPYTECPHGALHTVFSTTQSGHSITQFDP